MLLDSAIGEWMSMLSLIFGGCCSNALTLELATRQNPHAGSLITFAQFLLVAAYGLPRHLVLKPDTALYPGLKLDKEELLRRLATNIARYHQGKETKGPSFVIVVNQKDGFSELLARQVEESSSELSSIIVHSLLELQSRIQVSDSANTVVFFETDKKTSPPAPLPKWDFEIDLGNYSNFSQNFRAQSSSDQLFVVDISIPLRPVLIYAHPRKWRVPQFLGVPSRIRLKKRTIPISRWAVQVGLFFVTSLLNNAAFGYNVPMSVHIIFRSGGLVVNMLMGWLIDGRRYQRPQIYSVILVTLGVICTTLSATPSSSKTKASSISSAGSYVIGILILTLALIMSGFMGLAQDKTYTKYGRGHWEESMFYLHFLALPGFGFVWRDLLNQMQIVNASVKTEVSLGTLLISSPFGQEKWTVGHSPLRTLLDRGISIPAFYFPLALNIITQLVCVSGVNRLTSRVNSLTVTLVLVVRKAVSLAISVLWLGKGSGGILLWTGAGLVLAGTILYTMSRSNSPAKAQASKKIE
ncbi:hypothetical protein M422DRAFT_238506 [Sphaerobolus stellatus SS14]|nr:hypothetical protein M422DRAFT_238506 [Sphaerobolus stellatus SS14]